MKAKVVAAAFSAHRAEIQVEASTPSWLVIAQNNHHWWRAYLDGAPFRLWRANYAFQAVAVPEGKHSVRLEYRDWGFVTGALLSVLTLMGCIAFLNHGPHCSPGELTPQSGSKLHALQTLPRR